MDNKVKMKHKQLKITEFEKLFLSRRENLLSLEAKNSVVVDGGDEIDIVQSIVLNEMTEKLTLRDKNALQKIEEALQRIKNGTFGICEECEEPIGEKRLLALPDCTSCISCAEEQEKLSKQFRRG